jgi:hypothetical protein
MAMTVRRAQRSPPGYRLLTESVNAPDGDIFRLEGEYWTIVYQGALCRLRDAKGLRYIAHLLRHPGERVWCGDLVSLAGRGGNDSASSAERSRLAVTKRVKAAVQKIEQHHAALGDHLIASIKTGYQCAYLPDPHDPISWSVSSN